MKCTLALHEGDSNLPKVECILALHEGDSNLPKVECILALHDRIAPHIRK